MTARDSNLGNSGRRAGSVGGVGGGEEGFRGGGWGGEGVRGQRECGGRWGVGLLRVVELGGRVVWGGEDGRAYG